MTTTLAREIEAFASAVRAELGDLPPDEIDDLTDGLEADLAERTADAPEEALGDPRVYAAELRAAAGHPPRAARSHLGATAGIPGLRSVLTAVRARWQRLLETRPLVAGAVDMLVALRPAWWVFRGAVLGMLVLAFFGGGYNAPMDGMTWLVILLSVVVSVQLGRGKWLRFGWMRTVLLVLNIVLVVVAPFVVASTLGALNNMYNAYNDSSERSYFFDGLTYNGVTVGNIYAYDAEGNPIEQVQLFDQFGDPLNYAGEPEIEWAIGPHDTPVGPSDDVPGRVGWNVYPLGELVDNPYDPEADITVLRTPTFPFESVRPLSGHEAPPSTESVGVTGQAAD